MQEERAGKKLTEEQSAVVKQFLNKLEQNQKELQRYLKEIGIEPIGGWKDHSKNYVIKGLKYDCDDSGCADPACGDCDGGCGECGSYGACAPDPPPCDCPAGCQGAENISCAQVLFGRPGFCVEVIGQDMLGQRINIEEVRVATSSALRIYVKRNSKVE